MKDIRKVPASPSMLTVLIIALLSIIASGLLFLAQAVDGPLRIALAITSLIVAIASIVFAINFLIILADIASEDER